MRRLFAALLDRILERPWVVLAGAGVLVVIAALLATQVEMRTSRAELAPPDDPDQARWDGLLEQYRASEAVIACVEPLDGPDGRLAGIERFADRLAAVYAADPLVAGVFHRFDVDWLVDHGLWLVPLASLDAAVRALRAEGDVALELLGRFDRVGLHLRMARRLRSGSGRADGVPAEALGIVRGLTRLLEVERRMLTDPDAALPPSDFAATLAALAADGSVRRGDGYLSTDDGATLFVLVTPQDAADDLAARRALLGRMREHAARVAEELPGFRVGFTGTAAMSVEEMDTVGRDTWRTSLVAVLGVSVLTYFVFRWRSHALLVLGALGCGVVWALGAVRLELGYLNLITSSFISTLIGVGVAYGIHPVSEYELAGAHTEDPYRTVRTAFLRTGPAVTSAALTTSVAFFSILLMNFRGFGELGLVAGVGVLLCLLASIVVLPALLLVYGRHRRRRRVDDGNRRGAAVDRFWVEQLADRVGRFPRATVVVACVVTLFAGWAASGLQFNTNLLDLLPRGADSLRLQRRMVLQSDLSPIYNIVVAPDLAELDRLIERAAAEPAIARVESVRRFLPADPAASGRAIEDLRAWVERLRLPASAPRFDPAALRAALVELESALAETADAAFTAGVAELAAALEEARAAAEAAFAPLAEVTPQREAAWQAGSERLLATAREAADWLRRAVHTTAPAPATLPAELRARFVTADGRPVALLFPTYSIFEPAALEDYVAASRRVSSDAIGFPQLFHKMSGRITGGFYRAVAIGALLVLLVLLVDLRHPRDAALAAAPLAMGLVWTLGAMRLLGLSFNFANLVAVPLIIGVGIDNGVHVIHRVRLEGREGMRVVLRHTGRAILVASLTTMTGFGSLALASHRGLASLGLVLLLGVGSCLATSVLVLPNLLVSLGQVRR